MFIYITFLLIQIGRHKHFFEEQELSESQAETAARVLAAAIRRRSRNQGAIGKLALLLVAGVVPILLMGKYLTTLLDSPVTGSGHLPPWAE